MATLLSKQNIKTTKESSFCVDFIINNYLIQYLLYKNDFLYENNFTPIDKYNCQISSLKGYSTFFGK